MPAAMRSASICVLPEPAPASTRMLVSSSFLIASRDAWSMRRMSVMLRQPRVRGELRILELRLCLVVHGRTARGLVIAELAVLLVGRMDERAGEDQLAQI